VAAVLYSDVRLAELNESFDYFTLRNRTDPRMFAGEPIWTTNELRALHDDQFVARSGCVGWVGCDVPIAVSVELATVGSPRRRLAHCVTAAGSPAHALHVVHGERVDRARRSPGQVDDGQARARQPRPAVH